MHFFRRSKNLSFFPWLLALALVLRSFIAPGFMLSVGDDEGIRIIFCDGPVVVNVDQHDSHAHHHAGHVSQGDSSLHISPVCTDWSTSGAFAISISIETFRFDTSHQQEEHSYYTSFFQYAVLHDHFIRSPPALV